MRLVVIGPTFPYRGGISHYTTLLVKHLRMSHEVQFYSFTRQYPDWLFPGRSDRDPSRQPLHVPCEYLLDPLNPVTWLRTAQRIAQDEPDALILQWWVPYWAPAFATIAFLVRRFLSIKVLFICHNVMPHETMGLSSLLARLTLRQGHSFIVHSEKDFVDLRKLVSDAQIRKTTHPTYEAFTLGQSPPEEAKQALKLTGNVVLFFGFVREYKGLVYLLQAMPKVLEVVQVHLLIVGEFWENKVQYLSLIDEFQIADHVTIVDRYIPNEEIGGYFSAANVVVLPYVDATQSGVIQLAFGFNKPVITTNVGGLAEVVKDGETGFVVPPRNSDVLADSIIRYFQEGLALPFQSNIEQSKARFDWEKLIELIEVLIQDRVQNLDPGPVTSP
jgi:glycosyltransferase involved in cell wall biosynthesis